MSTVTTSPNRLRAHFPQQFFGIECALPKVSPSRRNAEKLFLKTSFYFSAQTQRAGALRLMSADSARCSYVAPKREVTSPLTRSGVKESAAGMAKRRGDWGREGRSFSFFLTERRTKC